jgi:hypothetical protein
MGFLSMVFMCGVLAENSRLDVAYNPLAQNTIPFGLGHISFSLS